MIFRLASRIHFKPRLMLIAATLGVVITSLMAFILSDVFLSKESEYIDLIGWGAIAQFLFLSMAMFLFWQYGPKTQNINDYRFFILLAVLIRYVIFFSEPYLSNDVDRYLFDGYIAYSGLDPYRINHEDLRLAQAIELWQPPQEHLKYTTIYPPLAIAVFSLAASFGVEHALLVWKVLLLIASLCVILISIFVLQKAQKLQHLSLILFSPILIIEAQVGLHLDTFLALTSCLFLYAIQRQKWCAAGIVVGLGTSIKLFPIVLLLILVLHRDRWAKGIVAATCAVLTVLGIYGAALLLGFQPVGSIAIFFEKFRFASIYYFLLEPLFGTAGMLTLSVALLISGFIFLAWQAWRTSSNLFGRSSFWIMQMSLCLPILVSPVSYPWYFSILVPFIALSPRLYLLSWVTLLPLTYEVLGKFRCCDIWQPAQWPLWVVLIGVSATFLYEKTRSLPYDSNSLMSNKKSNIRNNIAQ